MTAWAQDFVDLAGKSMNLMEDKTAAESANLVAHHRGYEVVGGQAEGMGKPICVRRGYEVFKEEFLNETDRLREDVLHITRRLNERAYCPMTIQYWVDYGPRVEDRYGDTCRIGWRLNRLDVPGAGKVHDALAEQKKV